MKNQILNALSPYKTPLLSTALISLLITAFVYGHKIANTQCALKLQTLHADFETAKTQVIETALAEHIALQASVNKVADNYQQNKNSAATHTRALDHEVIKYVQKNPDIHTCTLPPAGLQLLQQMVGTANRGRDPRTAATATH